MSAYLGTEPIFILEGPAGSCELWADELGYILYFEPFEPFYVHGPIQVCKYANRVGAIEDAFEDAKLNCDLDLWQVNTFYINLEDTLYKWEEMVKVLGKVYSNVI